MTAADIDPLPDPASLDFLRGHCCSCSGGVSDCAATDGDNNNDPVSSSDVMGIFNDSSSLDTSRSILCFLRVGARPGPNSYEVYDRQISFFPRWCMRVGAVSGKSEPLSILHFGLWSSGGSAQQARLFFGAKSKLRGGLQRCGHNMVGSSHTGFGQCKWTIGVTQI